MRLLKEKSAYRPSRAEIALAWLVTGASGAVVAWFLLGRCLAGG
jgi:hypothetical protein